MASRTEKRLIKLSNDRKRLMERLLKAEQDHRPTRDLQARLVDATRQQIAAELRLERKARAA